VQIASCAIFHVFGLIDNFIQGCGTLVKMKWLWLRSSLFRKHVSRAVFFYNMVPALELCFFYNMAPAVVC